MLALVLLMAIPDAEAFSSLDVVGLDIHDEITHEGLRQADIRKPTCRTRAMLDESLQIQDGREMVLSLVHIQGHQFNALYDAALHQSYTDRRPDAYNPAHHFDRSSPSGSSVDVLTRSRSYAMAQYERAVDDIVAGKYPEAIWAFGAALHAWQDAFSHSNFAELRARDGSALEPTYFSLLVPVQSDRASALQSLAHAGESEDRANEFMFTIYEDSTPCAGVDCLVREKDVVDDACDPVLLSSGVSPPDAKDYTHACFNKDVPGGGATRRPAKKIARPRYRIAREDAEHFTALVWQAWKADVVAGGGNEAWRDFVKWQPPMQFRYEWPVVDAITKGCF